MSNINQGRKPIATKKVAKASQLSLDDVFGNNLALDKNIVEEIEKKGLVYRFVSKKTLTDMGGHHPRGWVPYKPESNGTMGFLFGSSPDGYIHRGDLILAVRSAELNERHKLYLNQEARRKSVAPKHAAKELRSMIESSGAEVKVHEGYEDEKTGG